MKEITNYQLLNIDFTDFTFKHRAIKKDEKPQIQIQQEYKFQGPTAQNKIILYVQTVVKGSDDAFELILHSACIFNVRERSLYSEYHNEILISLSYPYIRDKVISLTSTPFGTPVAMPLQVENLTKSEKPNNVS